MNQLANEQNQAAPSLELLADHQIPVLEDGFVRVVDWMGSDSSIVQAARVSYGAGTRKTSEDRGLIRYLMRHRHTTPFEMCEIKLHVRVPMDIWRQWIRHRTANVNEYSTRYSVAIDAMKTTRPSEWRLQAKNNHQGSDGLLEAATGSRLTQREAELQTLCREVYEERLQAGVAREQARKDLPLALYTEAYWKVDLHNLLHFLELRMAPSAQLEIRQYAQAIGQQIVSQWVPLVWDAFLEYRANAMSLSATEIRLLGLLRQTPREALEVMRDIGWLKPQEQGWKAHREANELAKKMQRLGMAVPW